MVINDTKFYFYRQVQKQHTITLGSVEKPFQKAQFYLEGQQTAVDLGGLNQSGAIIAVDICASLISGQVDQ